MNRDEHIALLAERTALQNMLAKVPEDDIIGRGSLGARLTVVNQAIEAAGELEPEPVKTCLTFAGPPVVAAHGIQADFGAKAVGDFGEAVAAVAASLNAPLAATGPIPNRQQARLMITGTAVGSFGFELEEYRADQRQLELNETSLVQDALERILDLLSGATSDDEEDLADAAAELDQRALAKVRTFVQTLADNDALCTLRKRDRAFRFVNMGQVRTSLDRLRQDNLHEESLTITGELQGLLTKPRTFQLDTEGDLGVITGKVATSVGDIEQISRTMSFRRIRVNLVQKQIGSGRPRYLMVEAPELVDGSE